MIIVLPSHTYVLEPFLRAREICEWTARTSNTAVLGASEGVAALIPAAPTLNLPAGHPRCSLRQQAPLNAVGDGEGLVLASSDALRETSLEQARTGAEGGRRLGLCARRTAERSAGRAFLIVMLPTAETVFGNFSYSLKHEDLLASMTSETTAVVRSPAADATHPALAV